MIALFLKAGSRMTKAAEAAIPGDLWTRMDRVTVTKTADIPRHADLVLSLTELTAENERWAAKRGAWVCCLPEGDSYVASRVRDAFDRNYDLTLLDIALRKLVA